VQHNETPKIIIRRHARDRTAECNISASGLRQRIRRLTPHLAPFAGILDGKGKIALMFNSGPSPVIRHTGEIVEVVSVLRPGQRVVCQDTLEIWVDRRHTRDNRRRLGIKETS
jgi:hypothetical protein